MSKWPGTPVILWRWMLSFGQGAGAYMTAASKYPEDDELRAWYFNSTLDCMRNAGVPIDNFLVVAFGLQESVPKMKKIWTISALARRWQRPRKY
ncbi:uncharacterized protein EDB91DRAFT_1249284 [Suillus paluster]|uniref:uncharacterized protein n=1 Tax=Suillus paluster TaxID=48578 RepID=UPI001B873117|nr:uncharacterized protein EDB91DRAFT_1249284 [Suillus paluster]KAG1738367.1 hypothetical protein EDB91DRAFT_1249284 [Suillus paluster]